MFLIIIFICKKLLWPVFVLILPICNKKLTLTILLMSRERDIPYSGVSSRTPCVMSTSSSAFGNWSPSNQINCNLSMIVLDNLASTVRHRTIRISCISLVTPQARGDALRPTDYHNHSRFHILLLWWPSKSLYLKKWDEKKYIFAKPPSDSRNTFKTNSVHGFTLRSLMTFFGNTATRG